jgi:rubrerythrin
MRLVFENIDFTIVGHMQNLLEAEGIRTELRNAGSAGLAGEVPYTQVYPELWVLNNDDETKARAIIKDYQDKAESTPVGPDWTCLQCGESVEGIFAECWKCGAAAPA